MHPLNEYIPVFKLQKPSIDGLFYKENNTKNIPKNYLRIDHLNTFSLKK